VSNNALYFSSKKDFFQKIKCSFVEKTNIDCNVLLINTLGQVLLQKNTSLKEGKTQLDLGVLPSGIYTVQVRSEQRIWIGQLEKM
jgi:hypothetical protein